MKRRIRLHADAVLTEKANQAYAYAVNLAEQSLNVRRSADRRSPLTKGKGHYVDKFEVHTTINNNNRVRVELTNVSPVAKMIERGTHAHWIPASKKALRFPVPTAKRTFTGKQRGTFSVNGPEFAYRAAVRHPGGRGFQILGRTAKAVRSGQVARGTGIRSGR